MASLIAARPRSTGRRAAPLTLIARTFAVWRQRRHLASLDARALRDLGLSEADVLREQARPIWDLPA